VGKFLFKLQEDLSFVFFLVSAFPTSFTSNNSYEITVFKCICWGNVQEDSKLEGLS